MSLSLVQGGLYIDEISLTKADVPVTTVEPVETTDSTNLLTSTNLLPLFRLNYS